ICGGYYRGGGLFPMDLAELILGNQARISHLFDTPSPVAKIAAELIQSVDSSIGARAAELIQSVDSSIGARVAAFKDEIARIEQAQAPFLAALKEQTKIADEVSAAFAAVGDTMLRRLEGYS